MNTTIPSISVNEVVQRLVVLRGREPCGTNVSKPRWDVVFKYFDP